MKQRLLTLFVAAAMFAVCCVCETTAQAQSPYFGNGYGSGFYGNGFFGSSNTGLYGVDKLFVPPYHAVHPPVYYSMPVPRPYGYSPFALLPGQQPAEPVPAAQPEVIMNPHVDDRDVQEEVEAKEASARGNVARRAKPQLILNPFVDHQLELATLPVVE